MARLRGSHRQKGAQSRSPERGLQHRVAGGIDGKNPRLFTIVDDVAGKKDDEVINRFADTVRPFGQCLHFQTGEVRALNHLEAFGFECRDKAIVFTRYPALVAQIFIVAVANNQREISG